MQFLLWVVSMDFYTTVLRQSGEYWVALCLENGTVGQGETQESAIAKLKEAIDSLETIRQAGVELESAPVPIKELHEFLTIEQYHFGF